MQQLNYIKNMEFLVKTFGNEDYLSLSAVCDGKGSCGGKYDGGGKGSGGGGSGKGGSGGDGKGGSGNGEKGGSGGGGKNKAYENFSDHEDYSDIIGDYSECDVYF